MQGGGARRWCERCDTLRALVVPSGHEPYAAGDFRFDEKKQPDGPRTRAPRLFL